MNGKKKTICQKSQHEQSTCTCTKPDGSNKRKQSNPYTILTLLDVYNTLFNYPTTLLTDYFHITHKDGATAAATTDRTLTHINNKFKARPNVYDKTKSQTSTNLHNLNTKKNQTRP